MRASVAAPRLCVIFNRSILRRVVCEDRITTEAQSPQRAAQRKFFWWCREPDRDAVTHGLPITQRQLWVILCVLLCVSVTLWWFVRFKMIKRCGAKPRKSMPVTQICRASGAPSPASRVSMGNNSGALVGQHFLPGNASGALEVYRTPVNRRGLPPCHPDRASNANEWRDPFDSAFDLAQDKPMGWVWVC